MSRMTNIHDLKDEKQAKVDVLLRDCNVFWAFSTEQFEEGRKKNPLQEGDKYCRIPHGGFMPVSKVKKLGDGMKEIENWYKEAVKNTKMRRDNIIYELSNHEAWYTHDIESTIMALGDDYTAAEVWKVFYEEIKNQTANV